MVQVGLTMRLIDKAIPWSNPKQKKI